MTSSSLLKTRPISAGAKAFRLDFFSIKPARSARFAIGHLRKNLASTAKLLTEGGDTRITSGSNGCNRYGCSSLPEPAVLAFGSSTASTISSTGFAAADALRNRLDVAAADEPSYITYERELNRVRGELVQLCGLSELDGLNIIFGASGTDLHLFAAQLMVEPHALAPLILRVEAAETGRGVPDALAGCHFSETAAMGDPVIANAPLDCGRAIEIREVKCRTSDGNLREAEAIDTEVEKIVVSAAEKGQRVLLTVVDVSKTGVIAPSLGCVDSLRQRFPKVIEVFVDACQFRLSNSTLKAYLEHNFLVAITGSKFVTGPTFCGALLVPVDTTKRLRSRKLPRALKSYSSRADWPRNWAARTALKSVANYGLLLRWEAALAELRAFRRLPEADVEAFLENFASVVTKKMSDDPAFEIVASPSLNRDAVAPAQSWDRLTTIFPFLLRKNTSNGKSTLLSLVETTKVHELLREDLSWLEVATHAFLSSRCQLGQPVSLGARNGSPVSALRLCLGTRLIVDALSPEGRGIEAVFADAVAVLDKAAFLASQPLI